MSGVLKDSGYEIDFAHITFAWDHDSTGKAAVHYVIIGFSFKANRAEKALGICESSRQPYG